MTPVAAIRVGPLTWHQYLGRLSERMRGRAESHRVATDVSFGVTGTSEHAAELGAILATVTSAVIQHAKGKVDRREVYRTVGAVYGMTADEFAAKIGVPVEGGAA